MMLADLGADVVKVERPGGGDPTRSWGPPFVEGESTYFLSTNRGKRSICIDLAGSRGRRARPPPGRARRHRDRELPPRRRPTASDSASRRCARSRPSLVYCSIAGYPDDGPDAGRPGFDFAIQGEGGVMSITGEPDGDPMKVGVAIADITAGMYATVGDPRRAPPGRGDRHRQPRPGVALRRPARVAREPRLRPPRRRRGAGAPRQRAPGDRAVRELPRARRPRDRRDRHRRPVRALLPGGVARRAARRSPVQHEPAARAAPRRAHARCSRRRSRSGRSPTGSS